RSCTRESGRDGVDRKGASRRSLRLRGLVPKKQESLEEDQCEARKASAAKRKAAKEEKESPADQEGPLPESSVQDAHQVLPDTNSSNGAEEGGGDNGEGGAELAGSEPDLVEDKSGIPEESVEASEGGADLPDQEVEAVDDARTESPDEGLTIKEECPLSTVREDTVLPDAEVPAHLPRDGVVQTAAPQIIDVDAEVRTMPHLASGIKQEAEESRAVAVQLTEFHARDYMADQVRRWEQTPPGRITPPNVEYVGPNGTSDMTGWKVAGPERRMFLLAEDLTAVTIPPGLATPGESVAALQTLLREAGFEFTNLIPECEAVGKLKQEFESKITGATTLKPIEAEEAAHEERQRLELSLCEYQDQMEAGHARRAAEADHVTTCLQEQLRVLQTVRDWEREAAANMQKV
ncbi:hypothetical protein JG688_00002509, partial [Phytophthora aleatoria]